MAEPSFRQRQFKPWVLGVVIALSMVFGTAIGNNVVEPRWAQVLVGAGAAAGIGLVLSLIVVAIQKRRAAK